MEISWKKYFILVVFQVPIISSRLRGEREKHKAWIAAFFFAVLNRLVSLGKDQPWWWISISSNCASLLESIPTFIWRVCFGSSSSYVCFLKHPYHHRIPHLIQVAIQDSLWVSLYFFPECVAKASCFTLGVWGWRRIRSTLLWCPQPSAPVCQRPWWGKNGRVCGGSCLIESFKRSPHCFSTKCCVKISRVVADSMFGSLVVSCARQDHSPSSIESGVSAWAQFFFL